MCRYFPVIKAFWEKYIFIELWLSAHHQVIIKAGLNHITYLSTPSLHYYTKLNIYLFPLLPYNLPADRDAARLTTDGETPSRFYLALLILNANGANSWRTVSPLRLVHLPFPCLERYAG